MNLCFADMAGAGYTLSHALNKIPDMQAINMRANNNYIDYPTIADMKFYREETCRQMVYKADVVVFHTAIKPFMTGLHLDPREIKGKKLLYFHGSDVRTYGKEIIKQADEALVKYELLVSTPDLLQLVPQALWMPVARPISELIKQYGTCAPDRRALKTFGGDIRKIVVSHAPTSVERKGSALFFKVITALVQHNPLVEYQVIQNITWDQCLRALGRSSIYFDQHLIGAYGLAAIEASMFKAAVFCKLNPNCIDFYEKESGMKQPFIQWDTEEDLQNKALMLVDNPSLVRKFGKKGYEYTRKVHDEKPVAERFLKILEGMD